MKMFKSIFRKKTANQDFIIDKETLSKSTLFDKTWYLESYPDVAKSGIDPRIHYLNEGWKEGREPSLLFDTSFYLSQVHSLPENLQVVENPLMHFLKVGEGLGLKPIPETGLDNSQPLKPQSQRKMNEVAIIVPVFNALNELKLCLQSVIENTFFPCRVLLINDASTDEKIRPFLNEYLAYEWFEVFHNEKNLGFSGTVNKGLHLAGDSDVVLLNSDTQVSPGWLGRLRVSAYKKDNIGTVTPVSNNAGAFSVPVAGYNQVPDPYSIDSLGRAVSRLSFKAKPKVPTGNGFCMYIRRDCLDDVGQFDAEAFPRGYGEENDFCMRAHRNGWLHVIDPNTWIYHVRSASFLDDKAGLIKNGREIIDKRYPEYKSLVSQAFSSSKILDMRNAVKELYQSNSKQAKLAPRIVYVLSTQTGGTPQTNQDLMSALDDRIEAFVLSCDSKIIKFKSYLNGEYNELARYTLEQKIEPISHRSLEYDAVVKVWLQKWSIELVHIRHIAWHSLGLVGVTKELGIPCLFSFHDFYTICPSVKLLDNKNHYYGDGGKIIGDDYNNELWPQESFDRINGNQIKHWRRVFKSFLDECNGFITTNNQAKALLISYYPSLEKKPFKVIAHGRDFEKFESFGIPPTEKQPLKLLVLGNISIAKGGAFIESLALNVPDTILDIHILGKVSPELNLPNHVTCHGEYKRENLKQHIKDIKPNIGVVLSVWPETWCHTLTEYWACGIPVIATNMGAVGERVQESGGGWLMGGLNGEELKQIILNITASDWQHKYQKVLQWQKTTGLMQNTNFMAINYWMLYQEAWTPLGDKVDQSN